MASAVAEVWYTILVEVNFTLVTPYYYELSLPARCAVDNYVQFRYNHYPPPFNTRKEEPYAKI